MGEAEEASLHVHEREEAAEKCSINTEQVLDEFCSDASFIENTLTESDCEDLIKYSTSKHSEAQDAINYIEEKLKFNFYMY